MIKKIFFKLADSIAILLLLLTVALVLVMMTGIFADLTKSFDNDKRIESGPKWEKIELTKEQTKQNSLYYTQKVYTPSGEIYLAKTNKFMDGEVEKSRTEYRDFDGEKVNIFPLSFGNDASIFRHQEYEFDMLTQMRPGAKEIIIDVTKGQKITQRWQWESLKQIFVGYDTKGNVLGYAGINGVFDDIKDAQQFGLPYGMWGFVPDDSYTPKIVWFTDKGVSYLNFKDRKIKPLIEGGKKVTGLLRQNLGWNTNEWYFDDKSGQQAGYDSMFFLKTEDNQFYFVEENCDVTKLEVPQNTVQAGVCGLEGKLYGYAQIEEPFLLADGQKCKKANFGLYNVAKDGVMTPINSVDLMYYPAGKLVPCKGDSEPNRYILFKYTTIFSPVIMDAVWKRVVVAYADRRNFYAYRDFFGFITPYYIGWATLSSLVMAGLAFLYARGRCGSKAQLIGWCLFTIVFNLAGLLTCIVVVSQKRIVCHNCGKKRTLQIPNCIYCGSELEKPQPKETDLILA